MDNTYRRNSLSNVPVMAASEAGTAGHIFGASHTDHNNIQGDAFRLGILSGVRKLFQLHRFFGTKTLLKRLNIN